MLRTRWDPRSFSFLIPINANPSPWPYAALAIAFGLQDDLAMRRKSKPKSTKLSPRSAGDADIEIGRRIRLRRFEVGISQKELADKLGLTFQQVQKYERGRNRVQRRAVATDRRDAWLEMPFFYDGHDKEPEVDGLLALNSVFSLRVLRAYAAIKDHAVQRQLVLLDRDDCGVSALVCRSGDHAIWTRA
jgi:transcriptional regulator with XRE-family HTH domain